MADENNELKDFVKETLRQIDEGVGDEHDVEKGLVEFDVAISKQIEKGGKVGVTVLGQGIKGGVEIKDEKVSRIKFSAHLNRKSEERRWNEQMEVSRINQKNYEIG